MTWVFCVIEREKERWFVNVRVRAVSSLKDNSHLVQIEDGRRTACRVSVIFLLGNGQAVYPRKRRVTGPGI